MYAATASWINASTANDCTTSWFVLRHVEPDTLVNCPSGLVVSVLVLDIAGARADMLITFINFPLFFYIVFRYTATKLTHLSRRYCQLAYNLFINKIMSNSTNIASSFSRSECRIPCVYREPPLSTSSPPIMSPIIGIVLSLLCDRMVGVDVCKQLNHRNMYKMSGPRV